MLKDNLSLFLRHFIKTFKLKYTSKYNFVRFCRMAKFTQKGNLRKKTPCQVCYTMHEVFYPPPRLKYFSFKKLKTRNKFIVGKISFLFLWGWSHGGVKKELWKTIPGRLKQVPQDSPYWDRTNTRHCTF